MKTVQTIGLVCAIACLSVTAYAQPVIGLGNIPQIGDSVIIALSIQAVDEGAAGADQNWDMTWIVENEEQYFVYMEPSTTPWGDQFDDATLSGRSWDDSYSYYKVDGSGLSAVGYAGTIPPSDTFTLDYSDNELFIPLSYTFGDTHSDDFSGVSTAAGFTLPFTGDVDFEADGYGTLVLPTGTYNNVVRYHFTRTQEISFGGSTTTSTKDQWAWVSEDYRFWLLLMEETFDGFSTSSLIWYDKAPLPAIPVGVKSLDREQFTLFPNPMSAQQQLAFNWANDANAIIQITDMNGRCVWTADQKLYAGQQYVSIADAQLSPGYYTFSILTEGSVAHSKLIVNP